MENGYFLSNALALWSLAVGAFLCAVYDVFRLSRLLHRQNGVLLFLLDFFYCMIATAVMCVMFFNLSYGRMRAFSFVLTAIGFLIWRFTVSNLVMSLMKRLVRLVAGILNSITTRLRAAVSLAVGHIKTYAYCKKTVASVKRLFADVEHGKEEQNVTDKDA